MVLRVLHEDGTLLSVVCAEQVPLKGDKIALRSQAESNLSLSEGYEEYEIFEVTEVLWLFPKAFDNPSCGWVRITVRRCSS